MFKSKFGSGTVEWPTPDSMWKPLNDEFGFTLDVASTHENAKCAAHYTMAEDGLAQAWSGVCWMNPPYGRVMTAWLRKAVAEMGNGVTTVALVPARTNTTWWHDLCMKFGEVRFVRGRPKFVGAIHGLPQPLAIVVFRGASVPNDQALPQGGAKKGNDEP